jgi:xanthine dehydrogenase accessory factor
MNHLDVKVPRNSRGVVGAARDWLDEFGRISLATVVETWGSSPVPVGGQLVVAPGDLFEGSVSGGCVEVDVISEAADVITTARCKLLEFGIADETAWRSGLPCGGTLKVFLESLTGPSDAGYLDTILSARRSRTTLAVITNLKSGARQIREPTPSELAEDMASGDSRRIETPEGNAFRHVLTPPVRIIIAGATQIGQVLADLADRIGYDTIIVDPRSAFATQERFPGRPVLTDWPEVSFRTLDLDARTAVVALTHAAHLDDEALGGAVRSNCLYIGSLGSKRTHPKRLERLRAAGFSDAELARIHAPVGLAIGAKGPAEIALSILAEIVKVARGAV